MNTLNNALDTTNRLISLAPSLIALIMALETLFPRSKSGASKKAVVMNSVAAETPEVRAAVSGFTDSTVADQKATN